MRCQIFLQIDLYFQNDRRQTTDAHQNIKTYTCSYNLHKAHQAASECDYILMEVVYFLKVDLR